MRHRAALTAVLAIGAALGLGTAAHAYFKITMKSVYISSYQTRGSGAPIQVPGTIALELSEKPDGSLHGLLTQGRTRLQVQAALQGCPTSSAAAGQSGQIEIESWSWGETNEGSHVVTSGRHQLHFRSPKNPRCTLVVTLPPPPPPPRGPGDLTTPAQPPVPILLDSSDAGPGGDEPKDPGRSTEGSPPPPPPPGRR